MPMISVFSIDCSKPVSIDELTELSTRIFSLNSGEHENVFWIWRQFCIDNEAAAFSVEQQNRIGNVSFIDIIMHEDRSEWMYVLGEEDDLISLIEIAKMIREAASDYWDLFTNAAHILGGL